MLGEEEVSSYIDALVRLGLLQKTPGEGNGMELVRMEIQSRGLIGRILGGEFGEPPEGEGLVPWFSCILVKILLEEKEIKVSKEEFTGMAAVVMGLLSETTLPQRLHQEDDGLVISRRRTRTRK